MEHAPPALRELMTQALLVLGRELVGHPANEGIREELAAGSRSPQELYRQLLGMLFTHLVEHLADARALSPPPTMRDSCGILEAEPGLARHLLSGVLDDPRLRLGSLNATGLGALYESLLDLRLEVDPIRTELRLVETRRSERRDSGSYYTPPALVRCLLDSTLEPALDAAMESREPERALLGLKVCDPACGAGNFLLAAAHRIACRLARVRGGDEPSANLASDSMAQVVASCIHGVDLDPMAVELCRLGLWLEAGGPAWSPATLSRHIRCGNSLIGTTSSLQEVEGIGYLSREHRPFHWHMEFPEVLSSQEEDRGFDVVLGNPPFASVIEGRIPGAIKLLARQLHPLLGGTADLSYYFLSLALQVVRPLGRVGLVQPRSALNAPSLARLRGDLPRGLRPNLIYAPDRSDFFRGADVFICLMVLGPESDCKLSRDPDPDTASWTVGRVAGGNWWLAMGEVLDGRTGLAGPGQGRLEDVFEIRASMTAANAYDVRPHVIDSELGGLKLVTTGLIDPDTCLWGRRRCRYLKRDYQHPRLDEAEIGGKDLLRRCRRARRPKLLVAGLSRRVECFVDGSGDYIGAVQTFTILHPEDDLQALRELCSYLLSDEVTRRFVSELGGNAMGGGNITMKKSFLMGLPVPESLTPGGGDGHEAGTGSV